MNNNYSQPDRSMPPEGGAPYYSQWQDNRGEYGQPDHVRRPYQYPGSDTQPATNSMQNYPQPQPGRAGEAYQQGEVPLYQPTVPGGYIPTGGGGRRPRRRRRRRGCTIGCLSTLAIFVILFIFLFISLQKVLAFGSLISNQSPLSSQTGYMAGDGRINILMMGYGGSGHDGAYLTDSLVVMSLIPSTHHTTLISVPRDLWVQNPANSGNYTKLNAVYPVASGDSNQNPLAGGQAVAQKVSLITGLQINYWITINFAGFQDFINSINGVDVNVPDSFTANYPANDDPAVNASWTKVTFTKGEQHMDGKTAIEYARARYVLNNTAEASDFARSQRQQLIMQAALVKIKNWQTWPHMFDAMTSLEHTLYSNLSLADLGSFALKMDLQDAHRVGISVSNVLVYATADDGESIVLPTGNNWGLIPTYIQQQLYQ